MDREQFWAMVEAARTASQDQLSRQWELAAAQYGDLPLPEVERSRHRYGAAIADPDSLADDPELDATLPWGKGIWRVATTVYAQRADEEMPGLEPWSGELIGGLEALHSLWGDEQELRRRYPRLWARFRQR